MKFFFSLVAVFSIALNSNAQLKKFETAVQYNDFIVAEQTKIGETIKAFINIFTNSKDSAEIQDARKKIVSQADSAVSQMKGIAPFKGDTALKKNAISLFNFYSVTAAKEYDQLVKLSFNTTKSSTDVSKEMNGLVTQITEKEKQYDKNFSNAQKAFAARNNITLSENTFKLDQ